VQPEEQRRHQQGACHQPWSEADPATSATSCLAASTSAGLLSKTWPAAGLYHFTPAAVQHSRARAGPAPVLCVPGHSASAGASVAAQHSGCVGHRRRAHGCKRVRL
jgi:hypothetical protein